MCCLSFQTYSNGSKLQTELRFITIINVYIIYCSKQLKNRVKGWWVRSPWMNFCLIFWIYCSLIILEWFNLNKGYIELRALCLKIKRSQNPHFKNDFSYQACFIRLLFYEINCHNVMLLSKLWFCDFVNTKSYSLNTFKWT